MTPKEARDLWCNALESGQYAQTTGQLADLDGYCCLGVACELAVANSIIAGYEGNDGTLARYPAVKRWLGLGSSDGSYEGPDPADDDEHESLADQNDAGKSFAEIAALIRAEPKGLVVA